MYLVLFLFWLLLNGKLTLEVILLGLVITVLMAILEWKLFGFGPKQELGVVRRAPVFCAYLPVLLWEIVKAGTVVGRDILFRRYKLTPTLVSFHTDLKTDFGRFLLANSITLTPGTITVSVEGDKLTVHCLDKSMLDTSPDGTFQRWIRKMEGK